MGRGTLAALKVAVVVMGVLIVAGVGTLAVLIVRRTAGPTQIATAPVLMDEPAGTAIAGVAGLGDRIVLQLRGGGPDRVVLVDPRGGPPLRIGLVR